MLYTKLKDTLPENVAFYVRKPLEIASRVYANKISGILWANT